MPHFVTFLPTMVKFFLFFYFKPQKNLNWSNRELLFLVISVGISPVKKGGKLRADELVVALGLCESRTQAQAYILAGKIKMGTERIEKSAGCLPQTRAFPWNAPSPTQRRLKMENFEGIRHGRSRAEILDLGASTEDWPTAFSAGRFRPPALTSGMGNSTTSSERTRG